MKLKEASIRMIDLLEERILSGNREQILGYTKAADMIGWPGGAKFGQVAGKATSLIDYAAITSGLPHLPSYYVRSPNGKLPPRWGGGVWNEFTQEILDTARDHNWTREEFARLRVAVSALECCAPVKLWRELSNQSPQQIRQLIDQGVA